MSVIFGLFFKDGKSVSSELETMYKRLKHFPRYRQLWLWIITYNNSDALIKNKRRIWKKKYKKLLWHELFFLMENKMDNEKKANNQLHNENNEEITAKKEWAKPELQLIEVNKNTEADLSAANFDGPGFS